MAKKFFLGQPMGWEVLGNTPLTELICNFKRLCYDALPDYIHPERKVVPLTYESVMGLFDKALGSPDWPQNDHALPFKMPSKTPTPSVVQGGSRPATGAGSRGGEKRREAPDEPDPLSLPPHKRFHVYRPPADDLDNEEDDEEESTAALADAAH